MNICYATLAVFPTRSAHSIHIMKICQALADNAHEVLLLSPDYSSKAKEFPVEPNVGNIYDFYRVKQNFLNKKLSLSKVKGWKLLFGWSVVKEIKDKQLPVFTRDMEIAAITTLFKIPTILELHHTDIKGKFVQQLLYKKMFKSPCLLKIIVISEALKKAFINMGFPADMLLVAHDGSDIPAPAQPVIFSDTDKYIAEAGYVGQLYAGKGVELVLQIAQAMKNVRFHVVGGNAADIETWRKSVRELGVENIVFHGFVPQQNISAYINAFDVCLLPNQRRIGIWGNANINISDYTSPLKMFDYMSHDKAIVASALPVLKEVLNHNNAMLCDPEDVSQWEKAILTLASDKVLRNKLEKTAGENFRQHYTWKKRAEYIINQVFAN